MDDVGSQQLQTDIQMTELEQCAGERVLAVEARARSVLRRVEALEQRVAEAEFNVSALLNMCLESYRQMHGRITQLEAAVAVVVTTPEDVKIKTTTGQQTLAEEVTKEDVHNLNKQFQKLENAMRHYMDLLFPIGRKVAFPFPQENGQVNESDIPILDPVHLRLHSHDQNCTTPIRDPSQELVRASIDSGRFSSFIENQPPDISSSLSQLNTSLSEISHRNSIPADFPEYLAHSIIIQSTLGSSCTVPEENAHWTCKDNQVLSRKQTQHSTSTREMTSTTVPENEQSIYVNFIPTPKPRSAIQENAYSYVYDTRRNTPLEQFHSSEAMNDIKNEVRVSPNTSSDCTKTLPIQSELVSMRHELTKNPAFPSPISPSNETTKEKLQANVFVTDPHSEGAHNTSLTITPSTPDVTSMNVPTSANVHTLEQTISSPCLPTTVTPSKPTNPNTNYIPVSKTSETTNSDQSSYQLYDVLPHGPPIAVVTANVARQAGSRAASQVVTTVEDGKRQPYAEEAFRFSETQEVTEEALRSGENIHPQPTSTVEAIGYVDGSQTQNPSSADDEYYTYTYVMMDPENRARNKNEFSRVITSPKSSKSAITPSFTLPNESSAKNLADRNSTSSDSVRNSAEEKYSPVSSPTQKGSVSSGSCLSLNMSPSINIINSDCLASQNDYFFSEINGVESTPFPPDSGDSITVAPSSIPSSASASTVSGSPATDRIPPEDVTKLLDAAKKGDHRTCGALLFAHGLSIASARDAAGDTVVHWAAHEGHLEVLRTLLAGGAPVSERGAGGRSPLHYAVVAGHDRCIAALLAAGADPDARSSEGSTPLHLAALWGRRSSAKVLLANGANATLRNKEKLIPWELTKDKELRKMLQKAAVTWV